MSKRFYEDRMHNTNCGQILHAPDFFGGVIIIMAMAIEMMDTDFDEQLSLQTTLRTKCRRGVNQVQPMLHTQRKSDKAWPKPTPLQSPGLNLNLVYIWSTPGPHRCSPSIRTCVAISLPKKQLLSCNSKFQKTWVGVPPSANILGSYATRNVH